MQLPMFCLEGTRQSALRRHQLAIPPGSMGHLEQTVPLRCMCWLFENIEVVSDLRLAAFLETGATKLGDLPFDQVLIKVDGKQRGDKYYPLRVHGYALPAAVLAREGVHVVPGDDPATVEISNVTNWDLGSRTSLKQFHQTLLHRAQPKVGVVYGDGPDLLARALALKAKENVDEVVIAPSGPKPRGLGDCP